MQLELDGDDLAGRWAARLHKNFPFERLRLGVGGLGGVSDPEGQLRHGCCGCGGGRARLKRPAAGNVFGSLLLVSALMVRGATVCWWSVGVFVVVRGGGGALVALVSDKRGMCFGSPIEGIDPQIPWPSCRPRQSAPFSATCRHDNLHETCPPRIDTPAFVFLKKNSTKSTKILKYLTYGSKYLREIFFKSETFFALK